MYLAKFGRAPARLNNSTHFSHKSTSVPKTIGVNLEDKKIYICFLNNMRTKTAPNFPTQYSFPFIQLRAGAVNIVIILFLTEEKNHVHSPDTGNKIP